MLKRKNARPSMQSSSCSETVLQQHCSATAVVLVSQNSVQQIHLVDNTKMLHTSFHFDVSMLAGAYQYCTDAPRRRARRQFLGLCQ